MEFSPPPSPLLPSQIFPSRLQPARLIQRYKRFLADVKTPDGDTLTLHCANTGAMTGCATPGDTVWYSTSNSPTRRYPHSWELTQTAAGEWICVNTLRANQLVAQALADKRISELAAWREVRAEVKAPGGQSRFDFLLSAPGKADCYLEVKSVTLAIGEQGYFPDTPSARGQKHLRELTRLASAGQPAVLLFAILHSAVRRFAPAAHIDPQYARLLAKAQSCGVRVLAWRARISPQSMALTDPLPVLV